MNPNDDIGNYPSLLDASSGFVSGSVNCITVALDRLVSLWRQR